MRLRARQHRFLLLVLGGWTAARTVMLWPGAPVADRAAPHRIGRPGRPIWPMLSAAVAATPSRITPGPMRGALHAALPAIEPAPRVATASGPIPVRLVPPASSRTTEPPPETDAAIGPPRRPATSPSRLHAEAYLFFRQGGRAPGDLGAAPAGQLGGSQAAARITRALGDAAAIAARVYAPLRQRGAEAALGLDWRPLPGRPLRISIERRQRLDPRGRSAWSAYAAGGFYREPGRRLVLDGYAQAGIVGARTRDAFVDGSLRAGMKAGHGSVVPILGAGLWGAAQPGAARLDLGPRAALSLPVAGGTLSVALEGRVRVAGRAAPGSGATLTVATAF